ncbi:hypothetical protein [uncultured Aquimarina sp.]|uniref:hypothetical protein n=1 Tax=uncultured Aquimarina sp. TaxID=575652 RepID=UPI002631DAA4|nr:hypothetical protein [uncultured Aquimarina sp.]
MFLRKRILIVTPILWLGFVLSISFMEAWLKFQAEGVTQPIALSIGKLVFGVLNKVELFFFLIILIVSYNENWQVVKRTKQYVLLSLAAALLLQTFYLLPILDERAVMIINGEEPLGSYFHFYYILLEIFKVILLIILINKTLSLDFLLRSKLDLSSNAIIDLKHDENVRSKVV